jgi:hypothetical protein
MSKSFIVVATLSNGKQINFCMPTFDAVISWYHENAESIQAFVVNTVTNYSTVSSDETAD